MNESFQEFQQASENRPATDDDIRGMGRKNGLELAGLFTKFCIGPDPSKLMPPQEFRRITEEETLPANLVKMRAGGWTEEQIAIYLPALHGELDAMLLGYAEYGLL